MISLCELERCLSFLSVWGRKSVSELRPRHKSQLVDSKVKRSVVLATLSFQCFLSLTETETEERRNKIINHLAGKYCLEKRLEGPCSSIICFEPER